MDTRDGKERRLLTEECENGMKNRQKQTDRKMSGDGYENSHWARNQAKRQSRNNNCLFDIIRNQVLLLLLILV